MPRAELEPDWTLGVLLVAVTPPTVGASVFTFLVGGSGHALATSVVSLLISAVAMPASFVAEVVLFNAPAASRARAAAAARPRDAKRRSRKSRRRCSCSC